MKPVVDGLAKQYKAKVEFRRLNVETDQAANELAMSMGVTGVPTFIFVNSNGVQAGQIVGSTTKEQMIQTLDQLQ